MWWYRLRGGTAAEGETADPVLREREPGVEYDTGRMKIGDGVTNYAELPYVGDHVLDFVLDCAAEASDFDEFRALLLGLSS